MMWVMSWVLFQGFVLLTLLVSICSYLKQSEWNVNKRMSVSWDTDFLKTILSYNTIRPVGFLFRELCRLLRCVRNFSWAFSSGTLSSALIQASILFVAKVKPEMLTWPFERLSHAVLPNIFDTMFCIEIIVCTKLWQFVKWNVSQLAQGNCFSLFFLQRTMQDSAFSSAFFKMLVFKIPPPRSICVTQFSFVQVSYMGSPFGVLVFDLCTWL